MSNRARGRRKREPRQSAAAAAPAYVTRAIPHYDFLSEENLVRLENQADWLVQEIGLEFRDDPIALEIWREARHPTCLGMFQAPALDDEIRRRLGLWHRKSRQSGQNRPMRAIRDAIWIPGEDFTEPRIPFGGKLCHR